MNLVNWHTMHPGLTAYILVKTKKHLKPITRLETFKHDKLLFIHIPKNAGTSISKALFGWENHPGHYKWWFYRYYYGNRLYEEMFKFAICRNPFTRLISAYKYLKAGGTSYNDRMFSQRHLSNTKDFHSFCIQLSNSKDIQAWVHFNPQHHFVYDEKKRLQVDYIMRFEHLPEEIMHLSNHLNRQLLLPHKNKSGTSNWREFYDKDKTINIVRSLYAEDFDLFGYPTSL